MRKRKEIDVFGIVLGVIIGLLVGFFLSGRIDFSPTQDVYGGSLREQEKRVYLLEAGRFEDLTQAKKLYESLLDRGLTVVKVEERVGKKIFYYLYLNISLNEQELETYQKSLKIDGVKLEVKAKYLSHLSEQFSNESLEKKFWDEVIKNLYNTLDNQEIIISEEFYINPENVEIFSYFMTLKGLKNELLKTKYRLEVYRVLIESLS